MVIQSVGCVRTQTNVTCNKHCWTFGKQANIQNVLKATVQTYFVILRFITEVLSQANCVAIEMAIQQFDVD